MTAQFDRTALILGDEGLIKLKNAHVILFGVGGVGSFTAEALIRSGVGHLTLVDKDVVDVTNLNRQLIALHSTIGQVKVDVAAKRLLDINPEAKIIPLHTCYLPENAEEFALEHYDYVVDAIDMVTAKLDLICRCKQIDTPIISSMGTGNKLDPSRFQITDIYKTTVCPLAKVMRKELRARRIKGLKVLYSNEEPILKHTPPGSVSFVPSVAGLMLAGEVIKDLLK